jgi:hypothetical protein
VTYCNYAVLLQTEMGDCEHAKAMCASACEYIGVL